MKIPSIYVCATVATGVFLAACGGGSSSNPSGENNSQGSSALKKIESDAEFVSSFSDAARQQLSGVTYNTNDDVAVSDGAAPESDADAQSNYSTTYTVDAGVDEFDIVKYDGEHLFVAKSVGYGCCFLFDPFLDAPADVMTDDSAVPGGVGDSEDTIRILSTDTADATATYVSGIEIDDNEYVMGMYLHDDALVTVASEHFYGRYGDIWGGYYYWQETQSLFNVYDVSNVEAVSLSHHVSIQGGFVESRRIGNDIVVVTRHMPTIDGFTFEPGSEQSSDASINTLSSLSAADILPKISIDGESFELVNATDCFVNNEALDGDNYGYPVVTTISRIPINEPSSFDSVCLSESASGLYMSPNAVYITQHHGDYTSPMTRVHKFSLESQSIDYRGSADIGGHVWTGGQADFRLNEFDGQLRVMTSTSTDDSTDRTDYELYILQESATETALQQVSKLPNENQPAEIGKPNEVLFGVRFFGDVAYLVTFEQTDPLYILDLSSPSQPYIAGELEIPGVSEFLHPVSDDLLLGLGTVSANDWRVKLELFDVSNIDAPVSQSIHYFGNSGEYSHSEAVRNRHAFTYLAGEEIDRIAIPVTISGESGSQTGLHMLEIQDKASPSLAALSPVGYIKSDTNGGYYGYESRSVLHDDAVYFISGGYVWSAEWATTDQQVGPQ